jgi:hypothetical protein
VRHNPEAHPPPVAQSRLILLGGAVTVGWYAAAAVPTWVLPEAPGARKLRAPIIGPWLALGDKGYTSCDNYTCSTAWVVARAVLTVLDGLGQAGGLAMIAEGVFLRTDSGARALGTQKPGAYTSVPRLALQSVPVVAHDQLGLGLAGRF